MTEVEKDALELLKAYAELQERHKFLVEKCDEMYSTLKEREEEIRLLARHAHNVDVNALLGRKVIP